MLFICALVYVIQYICILYKHMTKSVQRGKTLKRLTANAATKLVNKMPYYKRTKRGQTKRGQTIVRMKIPHKAPRNYKIFEVVYDITDPNNIQANILCNTCIETLNRFGKDIIKQNFYTNILSSVQSCLEFGHIIPPIGSEIKDYIMIDLGDIKATLRGFCTVQYKTSSELLNIKISSEINKQNVKFPYVNVVYNVCTNSTSNDICKAMIPLLNVIFDRDNVNVPSILAVLEKNKGEMECYKYSGYSELSTSPTTTTGLYENSVNIRLSGLISHNAPHFILIRSKIPLIIHLMSHNNTRVAVLPTVIQTFAFIAHGETGIDICGPKLFKTTQQTVSTRLNGIHFYGFDGTTVFMKDTEEEYLLPAAICTRKIHPQESHKRDQSLTFVVDNSKYYVNPGEDINNNRSKFMGLWHCNASTILVNWSTMNEYINRSGNKITIPDIINGIEIYCKHNYINIENVELSIFACRTAVSETATMISIRNGVQERVRIANSVYAGGENTSKNVLEINPIQGKKVENAILMKDIIQLMPNDIIKNACIRPSVSASRSKTKKSKTKERIMSKMNKSKTKEKEIMSKDKEMFSVTEPSTYVTKTKTK